MKKLMSSGITLEGIESGIVYHYTNPDSFKKIISSQQFHLSNYSDLRGDPEELIWAFNAYQAISSHLFPKSIDFTRARPNEFFVLSTCKRENNEYLWNEYAERFAGMAIGLQAQALYETYNIKAKKIHMTSMDYDPEAFIELCNKSIHGLSPVAIHAPLNLPKDLQSYPYHMQSEFLNRIPGYKEYKERRGEVFGAISMQKGRKYANEEEVRIVSSAEGLLCNPLEIKNLNGKNKAILPLVIQDNHLISEIVLTPQCAMTAEEIKRLLRQHNIQTDVRIIEKSEIS